MTVQVFLCPLALHSIASITTFPLMSTGMLIAFLKGQTLTAEIRNGNISSLVQVKKLSPWAPSGFKFFSANFSTLFRRSGRQCLIYHPFLLKVLWRFFKWDQIQDKECTRKPTFQGIRCEPFKMWTSVGKAIHSKAWACNQTRQARMRWDSPEAVQGLIHLEEF